VIFGSYIAGVWWNEYQKPTAKAVRLMNQNRIDAAIMELENAKKKDNITLLSLAHFLYDQQRYQEALQVIATINPNNREEAAELHNLRGHLAGDDKEEAVREFKMAVQIQPNKSRLTNLAFTLSSCEKNDEAFEYFQKAAVDYPLMSETHSNLAHCCYFNDMQRLGLEEAETAILLNPFNIYAHFLKGEFLLREEKFEAAAASFDLLCQLSQPNDEYHKYSKRVLEKLGVVVQQPQKNIQNKSQQNPQDVLLQNVLYTAQ
jgi:tetratricopeptide (TPR) repeat protein